MTLYLALHKAVENGHIEVTNTLLQTGADIALTDMSDRTAAQVALAKLTPSL